MSQDILQYIKEVKQHLINIVFLKLITFTANKEEYRKAEEDNFDFYCLKRINETSQIVKEKVIAQPITKTLFPETYKQGLEEINIIAQGMVRADYQPPLVDDRDSLKLHLHVMWHLYETGISWPPSIEDVCLDLSFARLLSVASGRIAIDITKGKREEWRKLKGNEAKQQKKAKTAELIIEAFWGLQFLKEAFPKGANLSKVAEMIQKDIKGKYQEYPSPDTIKRALKNHKEIWKQFKETKVKGRKYFLLSKCNVCIKD